MAGPSGPPSKRRRVALACSNCRHRKQRCDGRRPQCSLCVDLGCACVYEQAGLAGNLTVGRTYLERLETRLADIESGLAQVRASQVSTPLCNDNGAGRAGRTSRASSVANSQAATTSSSAPATESVATAITAPDTAEDAIDGMGAIQFTDEEDWGYFGPSSNIAFLRHIARAMARMEDDLHQAMPSPTNRAHEGVAGGMSVSRPHQVEGRAGTNSDSTAAAAAAAVNIYALPPEDRTWSLIREYFQKTGRLLPFVHEATFCATYFAMKTSHFTLARRTWLGLLNIILAMAATLHVDAAVSAATRIAESDVYYQRAHGLCDKESRRNISVELVQYLLVLGQYLQGTQKSVQAWTVHGLAITTALQLGLQSPKTNRAFPPLECEIRKRVWYGCVLLDRTLSMTFGRPAMIHESYLKLALPITDMQMVGQEPQPVPTPQMDGLYYTATINLYHVMYRIIDTCYGQNLGLDDLPSDAALFAHVLRGEADLAAWKAQLAPNQLAVYDDDAPVAPADLAGIDADGKIAARYVVVLSVRYHNLQILLHRPVLERLLETCGRGGASLAGSSAANSTSAMAVGSVEACIRAARAIIALVHTVVRADGPRRDLLGAWNFSLFYTFNAALAIFAAMHVARCDVRHDAARRPRWAFVEAALPYFGMAIEALENLDRGNRVVERCVRYLSQLALVPIHPDVPGAAAGPDRRGSLPPGPRQAPQAGTPVYPPHHGHLHPMPMGAAVPRQPQQLLPMEIDLNEFMLDTDVDLLNMAWLSS